MSNPRDLHVLIFHVSTSDWSNTNNPSTLYLSENYTAGIRDGRTYPRRMKIHDPSMKNISEKLELSNKNQVFFTSNPIKTYPIDLKINILANFDILNMILGSDLHKKQSNLLDLIRTVPSQKP